MRDVVGPQARQVVVWRLRPEGTCGVGDHSRGYVRNLGGMVVDVTAGQRPGRDAPQLWQYVPSGWEADAGWSGAMALAMDAAPSADRVVYLHELRRGWSLRRKVLTEWASDLLSLRLIGQRATALVVSTEERESAIRALLRAWRLSVPVIRVGVASNVHAADPDPSRDDPRWPAASGLTVFARDGAGVMTEVLTAVLADLLQRHPGLTVRVLGARASHGHDPVLRALTQAGLSGRVELPGLMPAEALADLMARSRVALSLVDDGLSGRRGTVSAFLCSGVPVVGLSGPQTDDWMRHSPALTLAGDVSAPDAGALSAALDRILEEPEDLLLKRRRSAQAGYLKHHSWSALRAGLDAVAPGHAVAA